MSKELIRQSSGINPAKIIPPIFAPVSRRPVEGCSVGLANTLSVGVRDNIGQAYGTTWRKHIVLSHKNVSFHKQKNGGSIASISDWEA